MTLPGRNPSPWPIQTNPIKIMTTPRTPRIIRILFSPMGRFLIACDELIQGRQNVGVLGDVPLLGASITPADHAAWIDQEYRWPLAQRPDLALDIVRREYAPGLIREKWEGKEQLFGDFPGILQVMRCERDDRGVTALELAKIIAQPREMPSAKWSEAAPHENEEDPGFAAIIVEGQRVSPGGREVEAGSSDSVGNFRRALGHRDSVVGDKVGGTGDLTALHRITRR